MKKIKKNKEQRKTEIKNLETINNIIYMIPYYYEKNKIIESIQESEEFEIKFDDLLELKNKEYNHLLLHSYDNQSDNNNDYLQTISDNNSSRNQIITSLKQHLNSELDRFKQLKSLSVQNEQVDTEVGQNESSLYPTPTLLRARRIKTCNECQTTIIKPNNKASSSSRYKIKNIAFNNVLNITVLDKNVLSNETKLTVGLENFNETPVYTQLDLFDQNYYACVFMSHQKFVVYPLLSTDGNNQKNKPVLPTTEDENELSKCYQSTAAVLANKTVIEITVKSTDQNAIEYLPLNVSTSHYTYGNDLSNRQGVIEQKYVVVLCI